MIKEFYDNSLMHSTWRSYEINLSVNQFCTLSFWQIVDIFDGINFFPVLMP